MVDGNPNRRGRPYSRLGILLTHLLERKQNKMAEQCCYQPRQQEHGPVPIGHVAEAGIPKHLEQHAQSAHFAGYLSAFPRAHRDDQERRRAITPAAVDLSKFLREESPGEPSPASQ
jgi:hypothetical protein